MSKTLLAVTATSVASLTLLSVGYFVESLRADGVYLVSGGLALAVPGIVGLVMLTFSEITGDREYHRRQEEGRRYAERSDAEFRLRKQDQKHIDALEEALAA